jgi:hypothetical protein
MNRATGERLITGIEDASYVPTSPKIPLSILLNHTSPLLEQFMRIDASKLHVSERLAVSNVLAVLQSVAHGGAWFNRREERREVYDTLRRHIEDERPRGMIKGPNFLQIVEDLTRGSNETDPKRKRALERLAGFRKDIAPRLPLADRLDVSEVLVLTRGRSLWTDRSDTRREVYGIFERLLNPSPPTEGGRSGADASGDSPTPRRPRRRQ